MRKEKQHNTHFFPLPPPHPNMNTAAAPAPGRKCPMGTKHPPGGGGCGDGSCGGHSSKGTSRGQWLQIQRKARSRSGPCRKRFKSSNTRGHSWYLTNREQVQGALPMAAGAAVDPSEGTSSKPHPCQGGHENIPSPQPCEYPHVLLLEPRTTSTPSPSPAPLQGMRELLCFHKEMEQGNRKTGCAVFSYLRAVQIRTAELLLYHGPLHLYRALNSVHLLFSDFQHPVPTRGSACCGSCCTRNL